MRHAKTRRRIQRTGFERKALLEGLVRNLFINQQIKTTIVKAKAAQQLAEKLITIAKNDTTHSRRRVFKVLQDKSITQKLFTEIAPLFKDRSGGYTRVLHMVNRQGDKAPMALLELVEKTEGFFKKQSEKNSKKKAANTQEVNEAEVKSSSPEPTEASVETPKETSSSNEKKEQNKKSSFTENLKGFFKRKKKE